MDDPHDAWARVAAEHRTDSPPLWRVQSDIVVGGLIERWLPHGRIGAVLKTDLFDEAAGDGIYPQLAARATRAVGIDVSPAIVRAARTGLPDLEAEVADVRSLTFPAESFDAIVSNSTLDHLPGADAVGQALAELARVLRPGGRLLLTLDNPLNPLIAVRDRLPAPVARRLRGISYDSGWTCGPRTLRALLERAGLEVRETASVMHLPRALLTALEATFPTAAKPERWTGPIRAAEGLGRLPTRHLTGHFVAALAFRRERGE